MTTEAPALTDWIDQTIRLCEMVRLQKPRDPMRALEDVLLEMRHEVEV